MFHLHVLVITMTHGKKKIRWQDTLEEDNKDKNKRSAKKQIVRQASHYLEKEPHYPVYDREDYLSRINNVLR